MTGKGQLTVTIGGHSSRNLARDVRVEWEVTDEPEPRLIVWEETQSIHSVMMLRDLIERTWARYES